MIKSNDNESDRPFLCLICSSRFGRSDTLTKHIKLKHDKSRPFVCSFELCDKAFALFQHLQRHEKSHQQSKKFICSVCSEPFAKKSKLREHRKDEHNIAEFICMTDGCNKLFRSQSKLDVHKNTHKQRYMCLEPNCFLMMTNYNDFRRHKATEHKNGQTINNLRSIIDIDNHIQSEYDDNNENNNLSNSDANFCQVVNTSTNQNRNRRQYYRSRHPTEQSTNTTNNSSNAETTSSSVSEVKPTNKVIIASHKCQFPGCMRTYVKSKYLKDHVRAVHADEQGARFPCKVEGCDQRFGFKSSLDRHVEKIHVLGKRPRKVSKPYSMAHLLTTSALNTSEVKDGDDDNNNQSDTAMISSLDRSQVIESDERLLYKRGMRDIRCFDYIDPLHIFETHHNNSSEYSHSYLSNHDNYYESDAQNNEIINNLLGLT